MAFRYIIVMLLLGESLFSIPGYEEPWGKGSSLCREESRALHTLKEESFPAMVMKKIIWFHQNIISPADGPRSHFKPSSSNYMRLAIERYGFLQGYLMGCDRLLRENSDPWIYRTREINGKLWKVDEP